MARNEMVGARLSVVLAICLCGAQAEAATCYVSNTHATAADTNPGSVDRPLKTIAAGVNKAGPGDTVIIRPGEYGREVIKIKGRSGTSEKRIVIRAEEPGTVVLQGNPTPRNENKGVAFSLSRVSYVTIEGLLTKYYGTGISIADGGHNTVRKCTFESNASSGVQNWKAHNTLVEECRFLDPHTPGTANDVAIQDYGVNFYHSDNCVVRNCYFFGKHASNYVGDPQFVGPLAQLPQTATPTPISYKEYWKELTARFALCADSPAKGKGADIALEISDAERALQLLAKAKDDRAVIVPAAAFSTLGRDGRAESITAIEEALADTDPKVRWRATLGLRELRTAEALPLLQKALANESADIRRCALHALAKVGSPESLPLVKKALADSNRYVRESALHALRDLGGTEIVPLVQKAIVDKSRAAVFFPEGADDEDRGERMIKPFGDAVFVLNSVVNVVDGCLTSLRSSPSPTTLTTTFRESPQATPLTREGEVCRPLVIHLEPC